MSKKKLEKPNPCIDSWSWQNPCVGLYSMCGDEPGTINQKNNMLSTCPGYVENRTIPCTLPTCNTPIKSFITIDSTLTFLPVQSGNNYTYYFNKGSGNIKFNSNMTNIAVTMVGGGGGGSRASKIGNNWYSQGGGGGASCSFNMASVSSGSIFNLQIGTGGIGGGVLTEETNGTTGRGTVIIYNSTMINCQGGIGGNNKTGGTGGTIFNSSFPFKILHLFADYPIKYLKFFKTLLTI